MTPTLRGKYFRDIADALAMVFCCVVFLSIEDLFSVAVVYSWVMLMERGYFIGLF